MQFDPIPDDNRNNSLIIDQSRMLDVASRVPGILRRAHKQDSAEVVLNYSELVNDHGEDAAAQLVAPVEDAITEAGWIASREYGFPKGLIVMQIVAWRPRGTAHD
jgi:hypothetical protein